MIGEGTERESTDESRRTDDTRKNIDTGGSCSGEAVKEGMDVPLDESSTRDGRLQSSGD